MHYQHPCKCMSCQLHFVTLSWRHDWGYDGKNLPVCPECGSDALMRWSPLKLETEIFSVVPGGQTIVKYPETTA